MMNKAQPSGRADFITSISKRQVAITAKKIL